MRVRLQARRAPAVRAALLFGAPQTGKTALVHAVAAQAGAALFDLSPRATDGKYPGKAAALMVHMARAPCSSLASEQPLGQSACWLAYVCQYPSRGLSGLAQALRVSRRYAVGCCADQTHYLLD